MAAAAGVRNRTAVTRLLRELFERVGGRGVERCAAVCIEGSYSLSEAVRVETKGLLFDMDGVLISSIGSVRRCWRRWAAMYGVPNADTYEVPHGMRAIEIVKQLRPDIDPIEGLRVIEDMEIEDTEDLKVLPGVKALLESLPADRWAIVTSATRRLMLGRLEVAGLPAPERIVSADDVERGKPDPEPYRRGAELLGCTPTNASPRRMLPLA